MPRRPKTAAEKLADLEERKAALKKEQAQLSREMQRERAKARTEQREERRRAENQKKYIAGALALTHAEHDPTWKATLWNLVDRYELDDRKRSYFDLPPLPDEEKARRQAARGPANRNSSETGSASHAAE